MSSFIKHTAIKVHDDKKRWINIEDFRFYHSDDLEWDYDEVKAWFIFDWCSIPLCIFWPKVEPCTITSCCYHDWLVNCKKYWYWKTQYLFLVALRVDKVKTFKMIRYYIWVCIWCWYSRYKISDKLFRLNLKIKYNLKVFSNWIKKNI